MEDNSTAQNANPLMVIGRAVTTWVDAQPDEVARAINEEVASELKKIKPFDGTLPDEPQLARDCRDALEENGHVESAAKKLLAKKWGIRDQEHLDLRYREAFQAHIKYDKLRRERNAEMRAESHSPSNVTIGQRVIQLIGRVDVLVAENEGRAAWRGVHSLRNRLELLDDTWAGILLAVYGEGAELDELVISWEKVREHFRLDPEGRKIGEGVTAGQRVDDHVTPPADGASRPCDEKAYGQYELAAQAQGPLTDCEAYAWTKGRLEEGESLPAYRTWARYVRKGREARHKQKNQPRNGRQLGRSIVQASDIDSHGTSEAD